MALLIFLILLGAVFGIGAVLKGVLWILLIAVALIVLGGYLGLQKLKR